MHTVSLKTANQQFAKLIKEVERGEVFLITRRGRPVARLVPHTADKTTDSGWVAAYRRMMERLDKGASLGGLKVKREDVYDR